VGNKRARTEQPVGFSNLSADGTTNTHDQQYRLNSELERKLGLRYCGGEELLQLLVTKGKCDLVDSTFAIIVYHGPDPITISLDPTCASISDVKSQLQVQIGCRTERQELYRFAEGWKPSDQDEGVDNAGAVDNDVALTGPCTFALVVAEGENSNLFVYYPIKKRCFRSREMG
jgi:hypothetical protein